MGSASSKGEALRGDSVAGVGISSDFFLRFEGPLDGRCYGLETYRVLCCLLVIVRCDRSECVLCLLIVKTQELACLRL
jgi:hypothetical protein